MSTSTLGFVGVVRKGAWTHEEDDLLRKCIEKYGEQKWHQVPLRAGLNRCRKSCRLRWLNYLKPNIKRGKFSEDEVDLMQRLQRLLGNRWSLIAGRLPGRTANDVKNYWNTNLRKKHVQASSKKLDLKPIMRNRNNSTSHDVDHKKINVIKPRPWTFSRNSLAWLHSKTTMEEKLSMTELSSHHNTLCSKQQQQLPLASPAPPPPPSSSSLGSRRPDNDTMMWWERLLAESAGSDDFEQETPSSQTMLSDSSCFDFDVELWNILNTYDNNH